MLRRRVSRATIVAATVVATATALPVVYLLIRGFEGGLVDGLRTLIAPRAIGLLGRTLLLAVLAAAGAVAIGVPLAILVVRFEFPLRRLLTVLLALPLVIPSYIAAYSLMAFAGPRGILANALGITLPSVYGLFGAWFVITLTTYPLVFLGVRSALMGLDPSLDEASMMLGASPSETFRRMTWPRIKPAAAAGALLVALYAIHDFGAVSLLRYDTFSRAIFVAYQGSFDRSRAALLAIALVVVALVATRLEIAARTRAPLARSHGSAPRVRVRLRPSRRTTRFALLGTGAVISVSLLLPMGVLAYWVVRSARSVPFASEIDAATGTTAVTLMAAVATVVAAWPIARVSARSRKTTSRLLEGASNIGYALPGLVVALSLVFLTTRIARPLYQTLPLLAFAYVILFLPQASGALRASIEQIPLGREEASRALGAGGFTTLRRIVLPAVASSGLAAAALVFLTAAKELPATMLLSPPGFRTLSMRVFSETSAARFDQAAIPALLLLLLSSLPLALLLARERLRGFGP